MPAAVLRLSLVAAVGGVAVGVLGGGFRRLLIEAADLRESLVAATDGWGAAGWLLPVAVVAACAALARLTVRLVPVATGSGIQDVEAVWRGDAGFPPLSTLPAKFVGGLVAIGSGMALGREGPTVHMGAVVGSEAGRRTGMASEDRRVLQAALGGAGLAVAFNAPLGGSLFVFEEVAKAFRPRLVLVTLIGSAVAIACSRVVLGDRPDFLVGPIPAPDGWTIVAYVAFGAVTGLLGVGYNRLILAGLDWFARPLRLAPEVRAAVVGAAVGLVLWFDPLAVGGGDPLVQRVLDGGVAVTALLAYLAVRFAIGPWSYAAGTPGGLFAPLLAVGALWGALVQAGVGLGGHPGATAIVGMATFFAAVVRAPFTGIALIVEMTATTSLLVPMLAAAFAATLVAGACGNEPIYDSLRGRMPRDTNLQEDR